MGYDIQDLGDPAFGGSPTIIGVGVTDPSLGAGVSASPVLAPGEYYSLDLGGSLVGYGAVIDYAEDLSGVNTTLSTAAIAAVNGLTVSAGPTAQDVWVAWGGAFQVSTAGAGSLLLAPCDITTGTAVAMQSSGVFGNILGGNASKFPIAPVGLFHVGQLTSAKLYGLYGLIGTDSAPVIAAAIRSVTTGNPRSWIATLGF